MSAGLTRVEASGYTTRYALYSDFVVRDALRNTTNPEVREELERELRDRDANKARPTITKPVRI